MAVDLVLTIDAGTGSGRACVFSVSENRVLAVAACEYPIEHPAPDRAEWDPDAWWQGLVGAMHEAVAVAGRPAGDYLGLTATSLRQGFVLLDDAGEPLAPGVLNYDRRGADYVPHIEQQLDIDDVYRLTGHWHAPELTLPKLLWFKHEQPEVWRRAQQLLFVHDWVLYQLCGEAGTNPTMISAAQMADCAARTWSLDLLADLGLQTDVLPAVYEGGERLGELKSEVAGAVGLAAGTPVHIGGGDTQFGCLGVGGMDDGTAVIVGGSTTPIMMTVDRPLFDPKRYPWVSAHLRPGLWAVETNAGHTGMLYKWFRDTFCAAEVAQTEAEDRGPYEVVNDLAAEVPLGADGLLVVATNARWAQDTWERKAPYTIFDFNVSHTLGHVARAIVESVCYGVRGNLDQLERVAGQPFQRVLFTGGSAGVPLWAQTMADVLGRTLEVPQVVEPAAAAGAQLVLWGQGDARELPPPPVTVYEPDPDRAARYEPHYHVYLNVFEKMQRHFSV
ncbi:MAG: Autoinducer-2 kinase [Anaerolineales bacterium]|nr:Autoinducer-2 kinase [Anaerolineales bacterium]